MPGEPHRQAPPPRRRRFDWLPALGRLLVTVALVGLVLRRFSFQELRAEVAQTSLEALLLPGVIVLTSNVLGAVEWGALVRAAGLPVTASRLLGLYFAGLFFNNFGLGNLGGDVYKVVRLGRTEGALGRVAGATIADRLVAAAALCSLAVIAAGAALATGRAPWMLALAVLGATAATLALAAVILHESTGRRLEIAAARLPLPRLAPRLVRLLGYLGEYRRRTRLLHFVFVLALLVQASRVLTHFFVGHAMGWSMSLADLGKLFLVVPVLGLLIALPVSVGGWGVREWAGVALFAPLGRSGEEAVALLALTATLSVTVSLIGGIVVLWSGLPRSSRSVAMV
jgi:hypothetical protein